MKIKDRTYFIFFVFSDLAFGSIVSIKNTRAGGALLHSHSHLYPKEHGPEQQQVRSADFELNDIFQAATILVTIMSKRILVT